MTAPDPSFIELVTTHGSGVLATIKRDRRPQLSTVGYTADVVEGSGAAGLLIRSSITATRAKTKNLLRDPRASMHISGPNMRTYVVAEGLADLTPAAEAPDDATVDELVDVYRSIAGEHPDWDDYRAAMVREQRLVLRLRVDRLYGLA